MPNLADEDLPLDDNNLPDNKDSSDSKDLPDNENFPDDEADIDQDEYMYDVGDIVHGLTNVQQAAEQEDVMSLVAEQDQNPGDVPEARLINAGISELADNGMLFGKCEYFLELTHPAAVNLQVH